LSSYSSCNAAPTQVEHRRRDLDQRRDALTAQRQELTRDNQLRHRVRHFASRVLAVIDTLDFDQKQTLLRLVVEEVHVTGWHVQIRLRIPLDDNPDGPPRPRSPDPGPDRPGPVSTEDRLRSLGSQEVDLSEPARTPTDRRRARRTGRADGDGQSELGVQRIQGELLKLGHRLGASTHQQPETAGHRP
jgi:hypothetical protein